MSGIFHRVSIRKYQEKPVEPEKTEMMLRAAMAAPSACNQQPWEYYVVTDKKKILELSETSPYAKCAAGAPLVFVPCYRMEGIAPDYFEIDLSASVENLLLEADELGLGAVCGHCSGKRPLEAVRKVLIFRRACQAFALIFLRISCRGPALAGPVCTKPESTMYNMSCIDRQNQKRWRKKKREE